jgi:hypothetical protein
MEQLKKLKSIIDGRVCGMVASGGSIKALEECVKKIDICWLGMGVFNIPEKGIFKPAGKRFDIVFDCSSIPHARIPHYEGLWRIPRFEEYLSRPENNMFITTHGMLRDCFKAMGREDLLVKYDKKIMLIDKLFPDHSWMDVPNSATFATAALIAGGAKKVILFGVDGYTGKLETGISTYYKPNEFLLDRIAALGSMEDAGINRDTSNFEQRFSSLIERYQNLFKNPAKVYNCSPITLYTCVEKITYEQLPDIINAD